MGNLKKGTVKTISVLMLLLIILVLVGIIKHGQHTVVKPQAATMQAKPLTNATPIAAKVTEKLTNVAILPSPKPLPQFQFTDHHGKSFTNGNLKNKWTFVVFGFTHCQTVCPITMKLLNQAYLKLKTNSSINSLPQVVLISIDPARDTSALLNVFVKSYNPHFKGLRGSIAKVKSLAKFMGVTFTKKAAGLGDYQVPHTASVMLINPKGELAAYFTYPQTVSSFVDGYQKVLAN